MQRPRSYEEEASFLSRPQLYGGFGGFPREGKAFYARGQRQRINVISVGQALFLPWLLFCAVYAAMSFTVHYTKPMLCYAIVGAALVVVVACGLMALSVFLKKVHHEPHEPNWYIFVFLTMAAAWILGAILGDLNFWNYMQPYYDYKNLNTYSYVDPARMRGQQLMDAGRVSFTNTTVLDLKRSMGFKNLDTYCVAPITSSNADGVQALASYDFWAVGLDCCSGNVADFACGEYANSKAHGGLRLLRDDQRSFYRLAVQQAESAYAIKAQHPLFFYWSEDPESEMESFREEGYKFYLIGMLVHFGWQLLCVVLAVLGFAKLGHF